MHKLRTIFSLVFFLMSSTLAASTPAKPEAQTLIDAYRALNTAMLAADTQRIAQLTTEDFSLTHITGYRQSRAEWLAHITSGQMRYHRIEEDSIQPLPSSTPPQLLGRSRTTAHIWGAQGTWPLQLHIEFVQVPEAGRPIWKMQRAVASTY